MRRCGIQKKGHITWAVKSYRQRIITRLGCMLSSLLIRTNPHCKRPHALHIRSAFRRKCRRNNQDAGHEKAEGPKAKAFRINSPPIESRSWSADILVRPDSSARSAHASQKRRALLETVRADRNVRAPRTRRTAERSSSKYRRAALVWTLRLSSRHLVSES